MIYLKKLESLNISSLSKEQIVEANKKILNDIEILGDFCDDLNSILVKDKRSSRTISKRNNPIEFTCNLTPLNSIRDILTLANYISANLDSVVPTIQYHISFTDLVFNTGDKNLIDDIFNDFISKIRMFTDCKIHIIDKNITIGSKLIKNELVDYLLTLNLTISLTNNKKDRYI